MSQLRIAVDTGGTFTDVMMLNSTTGEIQTAKVPSVPAAPDQAVFAGVQTLAPDPQQVAFLGHGTTVAINALVQRIGARTGLITTAGFRDVLEIQRGNRPDMYNLYFKKPVPLVPRNLRVEVQERIMADGSIRTPLDLDSLRAAVEYLRARGVQALAVCFLNSYINPVHEEEAGAFIRSNYPDMVVTVATEVAREWREYERTSSAVLNSYLVPSVKKYLSRLGERMQAEGYSAQPLLTKSDGGLMPAAGAGDRPVQMLMSGPAGGVLGAAEYGKAIGELNLITFDIGGTTCDVSLIKDGQPNLVRDRLVDGYPVLAPFIDIYSIGAGGGTIVWADASGMLRVGPQSAGANPGPACYGRGGQQPTVTDAYVLLGMIDPDAFLGGQIQLDREAARAAFAPVAAEVGLSVEECARGALTILDHHMVGALRVVSIERGHDPRDFTLMAYGGAGALHIGALAKELGIKRAIVPRHPSLFSAWGILAADIRYSYARTVNWEAASTEAGALNDVLKAMLTEGRTDLADNGVKDEDMRFVASLDMHYVGQEHSVSVPCPTEFGADDVRKAVEDFHAAHKLAYTYDLQGEGVVITTVRLDAIGVQPALQLSEWPVTGDAEQALKGERSVIFDSSRGPEPTPVYDRSRLPVGAVVQGPCIVEEATSTTVLLANQSLEVDRYGNLICHTAAAGE